MIPNQIFINKLVNSLVPIYKIAFSGCLFGFHNFREYKFDNDEMEAISS